MKSAGLRECFFTTDKGKTWKPKKNFESIKAARAAGYGEKEWHIYPCDYGHDYHPARLSHRKGQAND